MNGNDTYHVFLVVMAVFILMLFKPQLTHWWQRRQRIKESQREAEMERKSRDK